QAIHGCEVIYRNAEGKTVRVSVNSFIVPGASPAEMAIVHFLLPVLHKETGETHCPDGDRAEATNPLLTERQLQILRLLARGETTRDISRELRISTGTVRNHSGKILQSLQAHTRLHAVATARALHLIG
ncbi:MAG: helix-turn-helix transcriptional regulator, partial [Betaproteobacteria bacterium]|nr:helix-turn-helix transcriptional regulator [Betaproteobacteria bacterium]